MGSWGWGWVGEIGTGCGEVKRTFFLILTALLFFWLGIENLSWSSFAGGVFVCVCVWCVVCGMCVCVCVSVSVSVCDFS